MFYFHFSYGSISHRHVICVNVGKYIAAQPDEVTGGACTQATLMNVHRTCGHCVIAWILSHRSGKRALSAAVATEAQPFHLCVCVCVFAREEKGEKMNRKFVAAPKMEICPIPQTLLNETICVVLRNYLQFLISCFICGY